MSSQSTSQDALKRSSIASLTALIGLQLFSRLFTFVLNQALIRMTSPEIFGTAAIQFDLILSTILFLSREGVRTTILRANSPGPRSMNLSFVPVFAGIPLATTIAYLYERYAREELKHRAGFRCAVAIYALAAVVELLTEPFHNMSMVKLKTNVRVRAEGCGITAKSVVTFLILLYDVNKDKGSLALLAFSLGQLAYSVACLIVYLWYFGVKTLKPRSEQKQPFLDMELFKLSVTMTWQSIIKHVLTEGDKLILSWFSPLQDQGGYALAVNYGSLIARIVFQPIEEVMRLYFSKTFGQKSKMDSALKEAAGVLSSLISVQLELSMFFLLFGTSYLSVILPILLPPRYMATSAPRILSAWVWYIPVLAVNGGLEGFVASVANSSDLNKQSRWMVVFSLLFVTAAVSLYKLGLGDAALVYANILNLLARITFGAFFTKTFFSKEGASGLVSLRRIVPSWKLILLSFAMMAVIIYDGSKKEIDKVVAEEGRRSLLNKDVVAHVGLGSALAAVWLSYWWMSSGRKTHLPRR